MYVLLELINEFNIDLKGFDNEFYQSLTKSQIHPVLKTLERIAVNKNHLEISYLVIPGKNDDPKRFAEIVDWIKNYLGNDISLHINRYFPNYKLKIASTTIESLQELYSIAKLNLTNVYLGNV